ncbi:MAG: type II toxin-antitoxin system Phd/YefM family antitoxin [Methylacidiphilales bacterium]|nr:type II toxin-antitoxin system Phd/YefM family antitoxin [Candidatus Methylacidiphilales bacterium]
MKNISVADTRQHLAEILGKVAYGGETFLITKKGRPMARLLPLARSNSSDKKPATLGSIQGWIEDGDPFFSHLEKIREESRREIPTNPFHRKKRSH